MADRRLDRAGGGGRRGSVARARACLNEIARTHEHPGAAAHPGAARRRRARLRRRRRPRAAHASARRERRGRASMRPTSPPRCGPSARPRRASRPLSTGLWIADGDVERRARAIAGWTERPLEPVRARLGGARHAARRAWDWRRRRASLRRLMRSVGGRPAAPVCWSRSTTRASAPRPPLAAAAATHAVLDDAGIDCPRLHHGYGPATWRRLLPPCRSGCDMAVGVEPTAPELPGRDRPGQPP